MARYFLVSIRLKITTDPRGRLLYALNALATTVVVKELIISKKQKKKMKKLQLMGNWDGPIKSEERKVFKNSLERHNGRREQLGP